MKLSISRSSSCSTSHYGIGIGEDWIHPRPTIRSSPRRGGAEYRRRRPAPGRSHRTEPSPETERRRGPAGGDYCYSLLTLQHNPPPVIAYLVKALLKRLKKGGVAALHVPIRHPFYRFDLTQYLVPEPAGSTIEMHILPREALRRCVRASGSEIPDSVNWGYTKGVYSEVFVITKP